MEVVENLYFFSTTTTTISVLFIAQTQEKLLLFLAKTSDFGRKCCVASASTNVSLGCDDADLDDTHFSHESQTI